jgi:hypothetical protein
LTDRNNTPYGTWQYRFIDWFRDLGFLQKPDVETKAAKDIATYLSQPARGGGRGGAPNAPAPANPAGTAPQGAAPPNR